MKPTQKTTNYGTWVKALRQRFKTEELQMTDPQLIEICKEFRSLEGVIDYLSKSDCHALWTTPAPKRDPKVTAQLFDQRQADKKRRQERIAELRKKQKEEKKKEPTNASQSTKPRLVFATPTKTTWSELSALPTAAEPPTSTAAQSPTATRAERSTATRTAKTAKRNKFVWKPTDDAAPVPAVTQVSPPNEEQSPPTQQTGNRFVWRITDAARLTEDAAVRESLAPPVDAEAELPVANEEQSSEAELAVANEEQSSVELLVVSEEQSSEELVVANEEDGSEVELLVVSEEQSSEVDEMEELPVLESAKQPRRERVELCISEQVGISIPREEPDELPLPGKMENHRQVEHPMFHAATLPTMPMTMPYQYSDGVYPLPQGGWRWVLDPRFGMPVLVWQ